MSKRAKRHIELFISYSYSDRRLARRIKNFIERLGLSVFLAHEDLHPSAEWQKEILKRLQTCDIFIPLLTKNFITSDWTDQETGIAFSKKKTILPLGIYQIPYGFISKYQGYRFKPRDLENSCLGIFKALEKKDIKHRNAVIKAIIESFGASIDFNDASFKSKVLLQFNKLSRAELNSIFRKGYRNDQIFNSYVACKNLYQLIEQNGHRVDEKFVKRFRARAFVN